MSLFSRSVPALAHDFAATPAPRGGLVLLAIGFVVAAAAAFAARDHVEGLATPARSAAQVASSAQRIERPAEDTTAPLRRRLALPWGEILNGIDRAVPKQVVLLGVDPDVDKGRVQIVAEARTAEAMASFVAALDATPAFSSTHLLSHEVRQDDPQRPLRFTVQLRWRIAP